MSIIQQTIERGLEKMKLQNTVAKKIRLNSRQLDVFVQQVRQEVGIHVGNFLKYRDIDVEPSEALSLYQIEFYGVTQSAMRTPVLFIEEIEEVIPTSMVEKNNLTIVNQDYQWALQVIRSCTFSHQLECGDNVIRIFAMRYPKYTNTIEMLQCVLNECRAKLTQ